MPENTHASLDHHIGAFMARLAAENYKPRMMKTYRVLLNRLVSLIGATGISSAAITMEQVADLARGDERKRREPNKCQNIARRFIAHLIDSSVAAAPIATLEQIARELLRVDYGGYLARQRGSARARSTIAGASPTGSSIIGSVTAKPIWRRLGRPMWWRSSNICSVERLPIATRAPPRIYRRMSAPEESCRSTYSFGTADLSQTKPFRPVLN
jgi:hypothetical protein